MMDHQQRQLFGPIADDLAEQRIAFGALSRRIKQLTNSETDARSSDAAELRAVHRAMLDQFASISQGR